MRWSCKIIFLALTALSLFFCGISVAGPREEITVSAAMSLKDSFEELARLFESNYRGVRVLLNFGGSGALRRQIMGGAPVDVFASASLKDMDDLVRGGLIMNSTHQYLAANRIVLIVPRGPGLHVRSFHDLRDSDVKRIAVGNPSTVPAGRYAKEIMDHLNVFDLLEEKLIFAENVRQVLDYVARGEADAGVVYATDAVIRGGDVRIAEFAMPESHSPVVYPIAQVSGTKNERLVKEFISLALSGQGQDILRKYGFNTLSGGK